MQNVMLVAEETVSPLLIYLNQCCIMFLPPYTIHKLDTDLLRYLRKSTFL